jgi:putative spermidine/putrescine transport system permease protein
VLWALVLLTCVFIVAPIFVVLPLAFSTSEFLVFPPPAYSTRWFGEFFANGSWTDALLRSLAVATAAMLVAVVLGTMGAYATFRGSWRYRRAMTAGFIVPLVVPSVVFGAGAYLLVIRLELLGSWWPLVCAHAALGLPYVFLNVGAAIRQTDPQIERAARTLGAGSVRAYASTTLQLTAPAIVISALLAFIVSLDEVVVALFLSPDAAPTLPVRMYSSIRFELDPLVPVASTLIIFGTLMLGLSCLGLAAFLRGRASRRATPPETDSYE